MFVLGCELVLRSDVPLSATDVTDLIESFVDELDNLGLSPDVSTKGTGTRVEMTVEVETDEPVEMEAFVYAFTSIKSALHCAGVHTGRMVIPTEIRPMAPRTLQDA
ncbi:MAG: hypothetical protein JWM89_610 [Acidimicrobiales bacterium]|nr:hypothetical protein [Acidimicrobiales bacterium]